MKSWKIAQEIYHRLKREHDDDLNKIEITFTDNIVEDALRHFDENVHQWIYPSKSYFVAICYASWLSEDFNEDLYELLNDPKLLAGNDPYYKTYDQDKSNYDKILSQLSFPLPHTGMVPDVRKYYEHEFEIALKDINIIKP